MEKQDDAIFAILMASGFSKRFGGENKLLAPFRGKPLARHTLELACGFDCFSGVFFVTADERVACLAAGMPIMPVRNAMPEKGRAESVRLGIQAALAALPYTAESAYYLFLPCDQPLLDAGTLCLILNARQNGRIVEPHYQGNPGSPGLFSAVFRNELLSLGKGERPQLIKSRHPEALVPVRVSNPLALLDVDSPEDLRRLEALDRANAQPCQYIQ
jgi:molybdenum cofactor cytidylyltransferase